MNILYFARPSKKFHNYHLFSAIYKVYGKKCPYSETTSSATFGHIKDGSQGVPDDIIDGNLKFEDDYETIIENINKYIVPIIKDDMHKKIIVALLTIIEEDKSLKEKTIGITDAYKYEKLLDSNVFELESLLGNLLYYVIKNVPNSECKGKKNITLKEFNSINNKWKNKNFELKKYKKNSKQPILEELSNLYDGEDDAFDSIFKCVKTVDLNSLDSKVSFYTLNISNDSFDYQKLQEYLLANLSEFVYSHSKIKNLETNSSKEFIGATAFNKFFNATKHDKGEILGDILLHIFLTKVLKAIKILTTVELDELGNKKLCDGIYFLPYKINSEVSCRTILGASNIDDKLKNVIKDVISKVSSIKKKKDIGLRLIKSEVSKYTANNDEIVNFLKRFYSPNSREDIPEFAFGIFIGYTIDINKSMKGKNVREKISAKIKEDIDSIQTYILSEVKKNELSNFELYVYALPFNIASNDKYEIMKGLSNIYY